MRGKRGKSLFILVVLTTLSATTGPARGTPEPMMTQQTISAAMVEPIADGTKNPALIPDEVALRVVFLTIADPSDTPRLRARFGRMKLEDADMTILLQKLGSLHGLVTAQRALITTAREAGKRSPSRAAYENVAALDRQLDTLAANTYGELLGSLSPEGVTKLRNHVTYIKTRIKILPPPKMAPTHH